MLGAGVVAGFPVVDVKVQLVDGKYHDVDSSALAFEIASRAGFREALQKGKSVLLEPIMKVEVVTPEDYTGSVIGDLNSRRGQIQGQDMRGNVSIISAKVPLMTMFGYVNNPAHDQPGPCKLHDAVRPLCGCAASARRRSAVSGRRSECAAECSGNFRFRGTADLGLDVGSARSRMSLSRPVAPQHLPWQFDEPRQLGSQWTVALD